MLFGLAAPLAFLSLTAIAFGWVRRRWQTIQSLGRGNTGVILPYPSCHLQEFTLFFTLGASSIVLTLGLAARVWLKRRLPPKQEVLVMPENDDF